MIFFSNFTIFLFIYFFFHVKLYYIFIRSTAEKKRKIKKKKKIHFRCFCVLTWAKKCLRTLRISMIALNRQNFQNLIYFLQRTKVLYMTMNYNFRQRTITGIVCARPFFLDFLLLSHIAIVVFDSGYSVWEVFKLYESNVTKNHFSIHTVNVSPPPYVRSPNFSFVFANTICGPRARRNTIQ